MEDKNIFLIKRVFENMFKGLTCEVGDYELIESIPNINHEVGVSKGYDVYINEPYRVFFNPVEFDSEYIFYKDDVVIFSFKDNKGIDGIGDILETIMPHLRFNITLNHDLIRTFNDPY